MNSKCMHTESMASPWSYLPFCNLTYPAHIQYCSCFDNRIIEDVNCSKISTKSDKNPSSKDKVSRLHEKSASSTSNNLTFGIDRILKEPDDKEKYQEQTMVSEIDQKYEHNLPKSVGKVRRKNGTRSVFSHVQRNILELHYQEREYVTKGERYHIAMATGISEEQVKIWFQNRRTKKKKLEGKLLQLGSN